MGGSCESQPDFITVLEQHHNPLPIQSRANTIMECQEDTLTFLDTDPLSIRGRTGSAVSVSLLSWRSMTFR